MTDPLRGRATAFLRRIGLLAGLLAIIAGILGMHVMSAGHGNHDPVAVGINAEGPDAHGDHIVPLVDDPLLPANPPPTLGAVSQQTVLPSAAPCAGSGTCTEMSAMVSVCVPAPSHNTLAAPLPGSPPYALEGSADAGTPIAGYSHCPASPSPGELCISRT